MSWFEVDRSARGAERAASLKALVLSMGKRTRVGEPLRRVVIYTRTPRIENRVLAVLRALAKETGEHALMEGRRQLVSSGDFAFEVVQTVEKRLNDGRTQLVDVAAGHVLVQPLPMWLPKFRLDGRDGHSSEGWFDANFLPYRRLVGMPAWPHPASPLG